MRTEDKYVRREQCGDWLPLCSAFGNFCFEVWGGVVAVFGGSLLGLTDYFCSPLFTPLLSQPLPSLLFSCYSASFQQLMGVEAFLAHHHAGDVGPPPAWGGIADDGPDAPCAVAGMFGCAPMNSTYDYWKNGVPWEGPPVVFH